MLLGSVMSDGGVATQKRIPKRVLIRLRAKHLAAAACALALSPFAALAQEGGIRVIADENPVKVYVDVRDAAGQPVTGLAPAAFQISENDSAQSVVEVTTPDAGAVSVVFLMDYSGSMEESGAVTVMQQAVTDALAKLDAKDRTAIVKFSGSVDTISSIGFTNDYASLTNFLATTPTTVRGSIVFDAIDKALEMFSSAQATLPPSSHSIVLLTDGADEGSNLTLLGIQDKLDDAGVSVFAVGLGEKLDKDVLEELSHVSGGDYAVADDVAAVTELYDEVTDGLTSEYLLTYNSAVGLEDCTPQTLQLQVQTPTGPHTYHADFRRCIPEPPPGTTTNPNPGGSPALISDSNGGGGGATGLLALLLPGAGLLRRRRHA